MSAYKVSRERKALRRLYEFGRSLCLCHPSRHDDRADCPRSEFNGILTELSGVARDARDTKGRA